ncbi:MAG TPA: metal ABC transporter ATP-binding protein [Actinomycetota bacterium]|nr:metal ABC transporter ATP-binding protein [Actinomycetota bacterium]
MKLWVRDVSVSYDGTPVLRSASFECGPGEIIGVIGPNGAGKSTLVKAVIGLIRRDTGEVRVDGGPIDKVRRQIAYLPQRSEIDWDYPALVHEVVTMGRYAHLGWFKRTSKHDRRLAAAAIERVGLSQLADRQIGELSGGQQQRVFLARALAQEARLLLLDEPFAGVDALTEQLLWREMKALRDEGATLMVINHDLASVSSAYDRLLIISRRVVAYGPTAEVFTAENIAAAYGAVPEVLRGIA